MITLGDLLAWPASDDRIYHFTSSETALEYILGKETLRFNSLNKTNDPREFEIWAAVLSADEAYGTPEFERLSEITAQLVVNVKKICKIACFTTDSDSSESDYSDIFDKGYCLPRMWSQYGSNHSGVCLVFSRKKLIAHLSNDVKSFYLPQGEHFTIFADSVTYDNDVYQLFNALTVEMAKDRGKTEEQIMSERIDTLLFHKYLDYQHEREFRIGLFSKYFAAQDTIDVNYGDSLEGIILGARFKPVWGPSFEAVAKEVKVPIFRMEWMNGKPDLRAYEKRK